MLESGKFKIFIILSFLTHVLFSLLFGMVGLSFDPPSARELSLMLLTRGGGEGDIIQIEPGWPLPPKIEPRLLADRVSPDLVPQIEEWTEIGVPEPLQFLPTGKVIPELEIPRLVEGGRREPPPHIFSRLPKEAKPMPEFDSLFGPVPPGFLRKK